MNRHDAVARLISDLHEQIDQMPARGIKNSAGQPYIPSYYKRGLEDAISRGKGAVVEYVNRFLFKSPSEGYKKLEDANSLDLACEALVENSEKPYAWLFSDDDRLLATARLAPHQAAIDARNAERRERIDARRAEFKRSGVPVRSDLDGSLRTRRGD
jgi:hypothetical protein